MNKGCICTNNHCFYFEYVHRKTRQRLNWTSRFGGGRKLFAIRKLPKETLKKLTVNKKIEFRITFRIFYAVPIVLQAATLKNQGKRRNKLLTKLPEKFEGNFCIITHHQIQNNHRENKSECHLPLRLANRWHCVS